MPSIKSFIAIALCALLLPVMGSMSVSRAEDTSIRFFPPDNKEGCNANTALMWDGKGNTRCATVIQEVPSIGTPLYAKVLPAFKNYTTYNNLMTSLIDALPILPASKTHWKTTCLWPGGQQPESYAASPINAEYCGRFVCKHVTGVHPFMTRLMEMCPEGGPSDCNGGRFYISWGCLSMNQ